MSYVIALSLFMLLINFYRKVFLFEVLMLIGDWDLGGTGSSFSEIMIAGPLITFFECF
jgi:hypothetical protein